MRIEIYYRNYEEIFSFKTKLYKYLRFDYLEKLKRVNNSEVLSISKILAISRIIKFNSLTYNLDIEFEFRS